MAEFYEKDQKAAFRSNTAKDLLGILERPYKDKVTPWKHGGENSSVTERAQISRGGNMKKSLLVVALIFLSVFGLFLGISGQSAVEAANGLKGTAYIAGHGGHLAVVDLNRCRERPDRYHRGRI